MVQNSNLFIYDLRKLSEICNLPNRFVQRKQLAIFGMVMFFCMNGTTMQRKIL